MAQINPYIHFNGNAEEAFTFYKSVFGGEFAMIIRFKDMSSPDIPLQKMKQIKLCILLCQLAKACVNGK